MTIFSDEAKIIADLDLCNLVVLNAFKILNEFGYMIDKSEKIKEECEKHLVGALIVKSDTQLNMVERPVAFKDSKEVVENYDFGKKIYEDLKSGKIDIELIYYTKKYNDTMRAYINLAKNTFLPKDIKEPVDKIIHNINFDISVSLKQILEKFILDVYYKSENKEKFIINPNGLYNEFNEKRIDNSQLIIEIREKTRKCLMIDQKW